MTALLIALSLATQPALALSSDSTVLALGDAVKLALQKNPGVEKAREKENEAAHSRSLAFSYVFPTLTGTLNVNYKKDALNASSPLFGGEPYNLYGLSFQLTQPLYRGGALSSGMAAAREQEAVSTLERRIAERDLTLSVLQYFYSVLLAQVKLETLERTESLKSQLLEVAKHRQKIGRSPLLDVLQAKTQLALIAPKIATARNDIRVAGTELALLLGKSDSETVTVRGALAPPRWEEVRTLTAEPRESLELERQERQLSLQSEKGDYTLSSHWPQVNAVGTLGRSGYLKSDLLDGDATSWALGLQAVFPLFSGLSSHQDRAIIASQRRQLELEKSSVADTVALDRLKADRELELQRTTIDSTKTALELARAAHQEAQKDYRLSTADFQQLLISEQNLVEAENAHNQARYDFIVGLARYFRARGHDLNTLVGLLAASEGSGK